MAADEVKEQSVGDGAESRTQSGASEGKAPDGKANKAATGLADGTEVVIEEVMVDEEDEDLLAEMTDEMRYTPLRVQNVKVMGGGNTKAYLIRRELAPVVEAETTEQVVNAANEAMSRLSALGVYDAVQILIDEGSPDMPGTCSLTVVLKEKQRYNLEAKTYVQGTEGSVELVMLASNLFSRADRWQLGVSWGSASSNEYALTLSRARIRGLPANLRVTLHQQRQSFQAYSSFVQDLRGGEVALSTEDGRHTLSYELSWRTLMDPSRRASDAVRKQAGHNLKSAVAYMFRRNTFDDPLFPTTGWGVRSKSEVAGLGADANLLRSLRQEVGGLLVRPLGGYAVLALQAQAGLLLPWGPTWAEKPTCISDRYFLGGVGGGLRGFSFKGVGPMDERRPASTPGDGDEAAVATSRPAQQFDSLGGDLYASVLASIRSKFTHPAAEALGLYGHVFVNGGNISPLAASGRGIGDSLRSFASGWRWSAGVGVVWPTAIGNVEVNYCRVLKSEFSDRLSGGLQVGFTLSAS